MNRLIIGCGYLGLRVADLWRNEGHAVYATTRTRADELRARGLRPVVCDVVQPETLNALPQVETVAYCVGLDRAAGATMRQVYVEGLKNVLERLPPPARFLYVSSTSVYGQTGGEEVDENAATEPLDESGRVVLEAEALLRSRFANAIVLRFAGIYGPGRLLRQHTLQAGQPLTTDPDKWLNLIHVEDGASAVVAAEQRGISGNVYNVCDGQPVQRREFYTQLAHLLRCPAPQFAAPTENAPVAGRELANRRISNRKMCAELGVALRYPGYREGLASIVSGNELN